MKTGCLCSHPMQWEFGIGDFAVAQDMAEEKYFSGEQFEPRSMIGYYIEH